MKSNLLTRKLNPMGTFSDGILGGFSGSVGPVVGSSWKGVQVMRAKPSGKRRKSTDGQLRQMAKMKLMSGFLSPLKGLLNKTYDSITVHMSCFNKALSYNMRNAVTGDYPAFTVNFEQLILGKGDLLNVKMLTAVSSSVGKISFDWKDNSNEGSARATDQAFVAVYCEVLNQWKTSDQGSLRIAGSYTLDVAAFSGKAVHGYIGFLSADGKFVSTSLYTGLVNIL